MTEESDGIPGQEPLSVDATSPMSADWDAVSEDVCAAILLRLGPKLRRATENLYEELLDATQDNLLDNSQFNIASTIATHKRQYVDVLTRIRAHLLEVGVREENYDPVGSLISSHALALAKNEYLQAKVDATRPEPAAGKSPGLTTKDSAP